MAPDGSEQSLLLQTILRNVENAQEDFTLQCSDNSNLHTIFAASQGAAFQPLLIARVTPNTPPALTAIDKPFGSPDAGCRQGWFHFHPVPKHPSFIYGASAQRANGTLLNCETAGRFWGLQPDTYLPLVFPGPPPQSVENTRLTPVTIVAIE